jgi:hypothetical protein
LPDDCSIKEIAERTEFMAAVQAGLDQLDSGEGIPYLTPCFEPLQLRGV